MLRFFRLTRRPCAQLTMGRGPFLRLWSQRRDCLAASKAGSKGNARWRTQGRQLTTGAVGRGAVTAAGMC
ncbi:hypothetical protein C9F11_32105 [Streptomyces sp. YIM 121038]|nr:hypothetical protein C9F11_32105 [Streptomyces sp. YIM 121038]